MKIEIGESLMLSYLKHIKRCVFYQTNWKVSSNWEIDQSAYDTVLFNYNKIINHTEFSDVFKSKLDQLIKQSEIDVVGLDMNGKIYTADIAFHENGLSYGSKIETKNRVFKKLLRSYLTLLAYFPNRTYELIFASPKVHNATEEIIRDYFNVLDNDFSGKDVVFKYMSNDLFRDEIVIPTIKKTKDDSDTNELFIRAIKLSNLFNMISSAKDNIQEDKIEGKIVTVPLKKELQKSGLDDDIEKQEVQKIRDKIDVWFSKTNQINSKILYAFVKLYKKFNGNVSIHDLEVESKLETFKNNFNQMKNFGENNHGKIFEQKGDYVYLWKPVEQIVKEAYKRHMNEDL